MARIDVVNVDDDKKLKAMYVCKCKGSDLSTEVKKMVEQLSKDFDEMHKVKGE